ncbi:PREDICTED: taste receptor type 2 member 62 [Rhinopithecus bieti]|uniref:taste receptor type 2 member 62 n=1 Tax=Rhinopithecus bieti TaxID=61621 RepID=UPI00083C5132|nr:PREDICTED: taste receptor type 2 member 62 [Rhinopithecus bieti]
MPSSLTLIFMAIFCLESLAAMVQNGFLVTVLGREWVRCRTLSTSDMIVACLAASRFCLHGVAMANNFLASLDFWRTAPYVNTFWDLFNALTLWFTALLAAFYCVKISSFSHPTFAWLKWRISRLVPRLIQVSLIICGLEVISSATGNILFRPRKVSLNSYGNETLVYTVQASYELYFFLYEGFVLSIPFLLFLVSTVLLIVSLCWHLGQMRDHRSGPCHPSTQAYTMALKSLTFSLIFCTLYFLFLFVSALKIVNFQSHWHWAWEVLIYANICLHSTFLVLRSPKLKKGLKTWPQLQCPCAAGS